MKTQTAAQPSLPCTRRQFLASQLVATTAILAGCNAEDKAPTPKKNSAASPGWIDAHIHLWTPDTKKFPLAKWAKETDLQPPSFTAADYLQIARPLGIEQAVLVQHAPLYGYDSSYLLDCMRKYPGVFSLIGMIDERLPELDGRLREQRRNGLRGLRINPTVHADRTPIRDPAKWLEQPEMRALWKCAAEQDVALCPLLTADLLPTLDPLCAEFPQAKCIIDHFGRANPTDEKQIADLLRLARHPNVYVKVSAFYQFGSKRPPYLELGPLIKRLVESFGAARLMWGSDCPYQLNNGNTMQAAVALIATGLDFLADADRQMILRGTAAKLFFA